MIYSVAESLFFFKYACVALTYSGICTSDSFKHITLIHNVLYICNIKQAPAKIHFVGFSLDLRLNVQMYVGPLCLVL